MLNARDEAWRKEIREAIGRAQQNVDLHIEREVYEPATARAVAHEFTEQLAPLLKEKGPR